MTIKTIFFDMGGTIDTYWYSPQMRIEVTCELQKYISSFGINLHLSDLELYELITNGIANYHQWRLVSLDELPPDVVWRRYILAPIKDDIPHLDDIADDLMVWIETHYYQRQMRPEIPAVLEEIHNSGYKIGLISNVNSRGQVPLNLEQYGIRHYFNPIVLSSEYRRRKPDASIFHYAARLSNTPTSECIYIGDRISRDIVGAKRAGYKLAIQIRHDFNHGETDDGATPDRIINTMTELLPILHDERKIGLKVGVHKKTKTTIRAVLFDADGVLYYRKNKDKEEDAFIEQHAKRDILVPEAEIKQLRHQAYTGKLSFEEYKTAIYNLYGITDPAIVSIGIHHTLIDKEDIHFFTGTLQTLKKLKKRNFYLGIVTDTAQPLHVKIRKLERGRIGHLWDSIISSSEVGIQKPDPRIYHLALNQLGITPRQAIFVGHKSSELEGAKAAGVRTIAYNYENGAKADFYIENINELTTFDFLK